MAVASTAIGGAVGVGEIVARYRDRPASALASASGIGYVALNAAASAAAFAIVRAFGWTFGAANDALVATQILVAGFGAMALFRSSLFTVRVGDQDLGVGPSSLLTMMLAACDRGVDRHRAADRAREVKATMTDVSFAKAHEALPAVALALMQNLDPPGQAALGLQVDKLARDTELTDSAKALLLGLAIATAVGPEVLAKAKDALGTEILRAPADLEEMALVPEPASTA